MEKEYQDTVKLKQLARQIGTTVYWTAAPSRLSAERFGSENALNPM